MFTEKDVIVIVVWSLFAYIVFGNIVSKAGYPRWRSLDLSCAIVEHSRSHRVCIFSLAD